MAITAIAAADTFANGARSLGIVIAGMASPPHAVVATTTGIGAQGGTMMMTMASATACRSVRLGFVNRRFSWVEAPGAATQPWRPA